MISQTNFDDCFPITNFSPIFFSAQHYLSKKAPFSTSVRRLIEDKDAKNSLEDDSFANLYAETQAEGI